MSSKKPKTKKSTTKKAKTPKQPAIKLPSKEEFDIREHAMLLSLTINMWQGTTQDRDASAKTETEAKAEAKTLSTTKRLLPKGALDTHKSLYRKARECVGKWSLPWSNDGQRIILNNALMQYEEEMRGIKEEWDRATREFADAYPGYVASAPKRLGDLFKPTDFPPAATIAGRYKLHTSILPIPAAEDFRVNLNAAHVARIRRQIEEDVNRALIAAVQDVWRRMREVVEKMAVKLGEYKVTADGREGVFRDSLVTNITEIVDLIPNLNITNDPQVAKLAARIRNELTKYDAETLREDDAVRAEVAQKAQDILEKMGDFV